MGPQVTAELERPGFFPAGGGCFQVTIEPVNRLDSLELVERGEMNSKQGCVMVANIPSEVGTRQARMLRNKLSWPNDSIRVVSPKGSAGPGNVVMVEIESESVCEVFTGFGERNVSSGKVIGALVDDVREYLMGEAPVGEYLADQLMIPFALTGSGRFRALKASLHARTNADVIAMFLGPKIEIESLDSGVEFRVV